MAVTPEMVAVALGVPLPEPAVLEQWDVWIEDALMLIDARKEALGVTDPLDPAKVDYVVREAVVAQVKRPDDATQVTVSIDQYSTSKTYQSGRGRVSILNEWWDLLGLTAKGGAFTIDTAPIIGGYHTPWCSIMWGAACSCGADIAGFPLYGS